MSDSVTSIEDQFAAWKIEDSKFVNGNNAAGARARKALSEMSKAIKSRRNEITAEKNARKVAKAK
jgi:hypothetical protein